MEQCSVRVPVHSIPPESVAKPRTVYSIDRILGNESAKDNDGKDGEFFFIDAWETWDFVICLEARGENRHYPPEG